MIQQQHLNTSSGGQFEQMFPTKWTCGYLAVLYANVSELTFVFRVMWSRRRFLHDCEGSLACLTLVLLIGLSTCVGLTVDMSLATQNLVFYETVCCLCFREGFCPVSIHPWIVLLLLSSVKYTLSGRSFLPGLMLLQSFDSRRFHFSASGLCVKYCLSVCITTLLTRQWKCGLWRC